MMFVLFFAADKLNIALTYEEWILKGQPQWGQYRTRLTDFNSPEASLEECEKVLAAKINDHFLLCLQESYLRSDLKGATGIGHSQESDGVRYIVIDCISPLIHPGDNVRVVKITDSAKDSYSTDSFSVISCRDADIHGNQDTENYGAEIRRKRGLVLSDCEVSSFYGYWMSRENTICGKSYSFQNMLLAFYRLK